MQFIAGMNKYPIRRINVLRINFECSNLIMSISTLIYNFSFYISYISPIAIYWHIICLNINKSVMCFELIYGCIQWKYNKKKVKRKRNVQFLTSLFLLSLHSENINLIWYWETPFTDSYSTFSMPLKVFKLCLTYRYLYKRVSFMAKAEGFMYVKYFIQVPFLLEKHYIAGVSLYKIKMDINWSISSPLNISFIKVCRLKKVLLYFLLYIWKQ